MAYQYDIDLEFLKQCENEELEVLFNFLSYNRDGQKRLNGRLLDSEEYKLHKEDYKKYWYRIAEEFQMYASGVIISNMNTSFINIGLVNIFNEKPYLKYKEILEQKLESFKIHYEDFFSIEIKEKLLFLYVVKALFDKLSIDEKQELLLEIGAETINLNELSIRDIFEKKVITNNFKFWKACKIIAKYISQKGLNYIFERGYSVQEIIFILIIMGLRKINEEKIL